jgi:hypothetical protein
VAGRLRQLDRFRFGNINRCRALGKSCRTGNIGYLKNALKTLDIIEAFNNSSFRCHESLSELGKAFVTFLEKI